ncbi:MAG: formate dehydrogenase subunit gamma [Kofleriaceae bacterium]
MKYDAPPSSPPAATAAAAAGDPSRQRAISVIRAAVAAHRDLPGALLPILHAIQDELGYLPEPTVPLVADGLNLSRAEVHGVITFYSDFRSEAPGRHVLKVCRAEACQAMGAEALVAHLRERHGLELGATSEGGAVTAEAVYCLGNCALSPAVLVDEHPHGRVSRERLDELLAGLAAAPQGAKGVRS